MRINSVKIILIARIRHKRLCFRNAKYFSIEERETETRSEISNAGALERESWNAKNCYIGTRNAKAKSGKSGTQDAKAFPENHAHLWLGYHVPMRYTTISDSDTTYLWDTVQCTRPSLTRLPRIFLWDTRPSLTRIPRTYDYEIHDHLWLGYHVYSYEIHDHLWLVYHVPMRYTTIQGISRWGLWVWTPTNINS